MTTVTSRPLPRRERKKAATRERIIATAIAMFSRRGIDGPTVDEIAEAADVGKGTIYNYFETKEHIVVAFMIDLERKIQVRALRLATSEGSLESILAAFLKFQFRLKAPYLEFVRVFLAQMYGHRESFLPYIEELQTIIDPPLLKLFQTLQERGMIRKSIRPTELVQIFKTIHLGLVGSWAVEGPPFRHAQKVLAAEIRLFCVGLERT
jgi:AcrR family transcriptional regulator